MNSKTFKKIYPFLFTILGIGFIFVLWVIISSNSNSNLFPYPDKVVNSLGSILSKQTTYEAIGSTLLRLLIAFSISFLIGFILGLIGGLNDPTHRFLKPLMIVFKTLPVATIVYVLVVSVKSVTSLVIINSLVMLPIMYEATHSGVKHISQPQMDNLRMDTSKYSPNAIFGVIVPGIFNSLILGIVQSIGLGMKVSIMSEVLLGSDSFKGIGREIYHAYIELDMVNVFAYSVIAILLIGIIEYIIHVCRKHINNK